MHEYMYMYIMYTVYMYYAYCLYNEVCLVILSMGLQFMNKYIKLGMYNVHV